MVEFGHICGSNACQKQYPDLDGDGKCVYQQLRFVSLNALPVAQIDCGRFHIHVTVATWRKAQLLFHGLRQVILSPRICMNSSICLSHSLVCRIINGICRFVGHAYYTCAVSSIRRMKWYLFFSRRVTKISFFIVFFSQFLSVACAVHGEPTCFNRENYRQQLYEFYLILYLKYIYTNMYEGKYISV